MRICPSVTGIALVNFICLSITRLGLGLPNDARFEVHRTKAVYLAVNVVIAVVAHQTNIAHLGAHFDRHWSALHFEIFDHSDRVTILQNVARGVLDDREFITCRLRRFLVSRNSSPLMPTFWTREHFA